MTTPATTANPFAARAAHLTSRGIPVVPVNDGQKRCTLSDWPTLATTDPQTIETWAQIYPTANTAAVCLAGGVCVLDADLAGLMSRIEQECGQKVPPTLVVKSGGKGLPHVYFRHSAKSTALGNRKAAGLFDFQADRKYVVGPGSVLENGGEYQIVADAPLAEIPDWLVDWLEKNSTADRPAKVANAFPAHPDFDIGDFLQHYGLGYDVQGHWYVTDVCPVAGHKHEQSTQTGFYHDGTTFGFKCFAGNCPGSNMSVGDVIKHMNKPDGLTVRSPYAGPIWSADVPKPAATPEVGFTLTGPRVDGTSFDFVLNPLTGQNDGWFPRGDVSLVSAMSGGGKTTLMADLLEKQLRGETVFGHATNKLPYLVIMEDRGARSLERTLKRMHIDREHFPYVRLAGNGLAAGVQHALVEQPTMPAIVFLEGIDLLNDASDGRNVSADLKLLQRVADHYHVAIIGSTGSPKQKSKDRYVGLRDQIIGSTVWARKTETIVVLQKETGKETDDVTIMTVLPRNDKPEQFQLVWERGRFRALTAEEIQAGQEKAASDDLLEWVLQQDTFTRAQINKAFPRMSGKTLNTRLEGLLKCQAIRQHTKGAKTFFSVPSASANEGVMVDVGF